MLAASMHITARLDETTVAELLDQLLPVTFDLHEDEPGTRWVRIEKPERFEFVADQGVRVHTALELQWTALGIAIPVKVQSIELMLRPLVLVDGAGRGRLVFRPEIEATDIKLMPAFLDATVTRAINGRLSEQGDGLAWRFGEGPMVQAPLPATISPAARFQLEAADAAVAITGDELRMSMTLKMRFHRDPAPGQEAKPGAEAASPPPPAAPGGPAAS